MIHPGRGHFLATYFAMTVIGLLLCSQSTRHIFPDDDERLRALQRVCLALPRTAQVCCERVRQACCIRQSLHVLLSACAWHSGNGHMLTGGAASWACRPHVLCLMPIAEPVLAAC